MNHLFSFYIGDVVYLQQPDGRCNHEWSGPHHVTALNLGVSIVLDDDGISRHISHVRWVPQLLGDSSDVDSEESVDSEASVTIGTCTGLNSACRSAQAWQPPIWSYDYDMY